ncbi:MAG: type IV pilus modification protein PilV [Piscirickettsiaceae bacterium]|nr:MAG: type IV pilus modification protein PilV [Piscirickettsiaceae bacterium]
MIMKINTRKILNQKQQTGSSLIEVLIALLILTVGIQGIASMQYQSIKDNFDSSQRSHGAWSAQELINRIRANPTARINGDYAFNGNPCNGGIPATYCADRDGNGAAVCTTTEMAAFDIWESICPTPNQAHNQNQSQLFNPNLQIICADAPCTANSEFTLTLQWRSKSVSDDNVIEDADDSLKTEQFRQVFRP